MAAYRAYTMYDRELGCGCEETVTWDLYDRTGNRPQIFVTREAAETAAEAKCLERGHDRWNVLKVTD